MSKVEKILTCIFAPVGAFAIIHYILTGELFL